MRFLKSFLEPKLPENLGDIHIEWEFPEFMKEEKTVSWYVMVGLILAACLIYAVLTANYLFVVILFLVSFIVVLQYFQNPRSIDVKIAEDGLIVDKKYVPYKALKSFWIIYEPPRVKYLYLEFKESFRKSYPIPLEDINPLKVREYLLRYIDEDLEKEEIETDEVISHFLSIR